jgi:hypothetical protein
MTRRKETFQQYPEMLTHPNCPVPHDWPDRAEQQSPEWPSFVAFKCRLLADCRRSTWQGRARRARPLELPYSTRFCPSVPVYFNRPVFARCSHSWRFSRLLKDRGPPWTYGATPTTALAYRNFSSTDQIMINPVSSRLCQQPARHAARTTWLRRWSRAIQSGRAPVR